MSDLDWIDKFEPLRGLAPALRQELARAGRIVRAPKGARVFGPGQSPQGYLLVVSGDIRVSQISESGREIVLFRVQPGESCALTTACLLGGDSYNAEAIAETDVEAVAIPRAAFDDLIARSQAFRQLVFAAFSHRLTNLLSLVDEIAFHRLDARLAHKLLELAGAGSEVAMTHQQLAIELGTAREVVSRQLNELQRRGCVSASRGSVTIIDRAALEGFAREV